MYIELILQGPIKDVELRGRRRTEIVGEREVENFENIVDAVGVKFSRSLRCRLDHGEKEPACSNKKKERTMLLRRGKSIN